MRNIGDKRQYSDPDFRKASADFEDVSLRVRHGDAINRIENGNNWNVPRSSRRSFVRKYGPALAGVTVLSALGIPAALYLSLNNEGQLTIDWDKLNADANNLQTQFGQRFNINDLQAQAKNILSRLPLGSQQTGGKENTPTQDIWNSSRLERKPYLKKINDPRFGEVEAKMLQVLHLPQITTMENLRALVPSEAAKKISVNYSAYSCGGTVDVMQAWYWGLLPSTNEFNWQEVQKYIYGANGMKVSGLDLSYGAFGITSNGLLNQSYPDGQEKYLSKLAASAGKSFQKIEADKNQRNNFDWVDSMINQGIPLTAGFWYSGYWADGSALNHVTMIVGTAKVKVKNNSGAETIQNALVLNDPFRNWRSGDRSFNKSGESAIVLASELLPSTGYAWGIKVS